jgi:hypothetical protein
MTGRPDLDVLEPLLLDERGRLRPEVRHMVIGELFTCRRRGHRQGFIIRTTYGPLLMWRAETGHGWQWMRNWLDAMPDAVLMTCHCKVVRLVDLTPYRAIS